MNKKLTDLVSELLADYFEGRDITSKLEQVENLCNELYVEHDCHLTSESGCELCEQLHKTRKVVQWFNNKNEIN